MNRHHHRPGRHVLALVALSAALWLPAAGMADDTETVRELLVSTHVRLPFDRDVERVAVADPTILDSETLTNREILLLGRSPGRTTVIVWFADGGTDSFLFHVKRDLSLLDEALREIHPSITALTAPDRDAVVLRGLVPDVSYSNAAEDAAQRYLDARRRRAGATSLVRADEAGSEGGSQGPRVEAAEEVASTGAVINLIRVQSLPGRLEDRIGTALHEIGAVDVRVRRLVRSRLPDDELDIFVLEGEVDTQVTLVRVLSVAQSLLGEAREDDIKVRADESGALAERSGSSGGAMGQGSRALSQLFGGSGGGGQLDNRIDANLARAKVVEAARGRLLSFLTVRDLPQVQVDIRLYEINSSRLRDYQSNFGVLVSNFTQPSLNPAAVAGGLQGRHAARVGAQGENPDVQNVLGFLAGTLSNQFQLSGDYGAVDWLLTLLESKGWARSLSRPSLTVLSGERAFFQVGGEVPVPEAFATTATAGTPEGVLNSVVFKPFGVQLAVRPLVGEEGLVTLDVSPEISLPDPQLTDAIRDSTGTAQSTTAFRTRYLQTTAQLEDGQALLIGGLLSRNMKETNESTPGLSDVPLIGGLFRGSSREGDEIQLVIVVHPVVQRKPTTKARMWAYPGVGELMGSVQRRRTSSPGCR